MVQLARQGTSVLLIDREKEDMVFLLINSMA